MRLNLPGVLTQEIGEYMFLHRVIKLTVVLAVTISFVFSPEVAAAQVEKRVLFRKGKTSAVFTGKLPRFYADYDAYVLKARKGQMITVKLTTT